MSEVNAILLTLETDLSQESFVLFYGSSPAKLGVTVSHCEEVSLRGRVARSSPLDSWGKSRHAAVLPWCRNWPSPCSLSIGAWPAHAEGERVALQTKHTRSLILEPHMELQGNKPTCPLSQLGIRPAAGLQTSISSTSSYALATSPFLTPATWALHSGPLHAWTPLLIASFYNSLTSVF